MKFKRLLARLMLIITILICSSLFSIYRADAAPVFVSSVSSYTIPQGTFASEVAYSNGVYLAVGGETSVWSSLDGITWVNKANTNGSTITNMCVTADPAAVIPTFYFGQDYRNRSYKAALSSTMSGYGETKKTENTSYNSYDYTDMDWYNSTTMVRSCDARGLFGGYTYGFQTNLEHVAVIGTEVMAVGSGVVLHRATYGGSTNWNNYYNSPVSDPTYLEAFAGNFYLGNGSSTVYRLSNTANQVAYNTGLPALCNVEAFGSYIVGITTNGSSDTVLAVSADGIAWMSSSVISAGDYYSNPVRELNICNGYLMISRGSSIQRVTLVVDGTPPSLALSASTYGWTRNPVTITATSSDAQTGVAYTKWMAGARSADTVVASGTAFVSTFNVSANNTYSVVAVDNAGNKTLQTIAVSTIDTVNPYSSSFAPSGTTYTNASSWIIYMYGVGDAASGIQSVQFPTWSDAGGQDDIQWYSGTQSGSTWLAAFNVANHGNADGTYYTHFYATDNAGNSHMPGGNTVVLDRVAPTFTSIKNECLTVYTTASTYTHEYYGVSDDRSGLNGLAWYCYGPAGSGYSGYVTSTAATATTSRTFNTTVDGTYTFHQILSDRAGNTYNNSGTRYVNVVRDVTVPTLTAITASTSAPTNANVTLSATGSDATSGVASTKWMAGNQTAATVADSGTAFSGSFTATANDTYSAVAIDRAGNISAVRTITLSNIDKTAPTGSASKSPDVTYNSTNTIEYYATGVADLGGSGLASVKVAVWTETLNQDDLVYHPMVWDAGNNRYYFTMPYATHGGANDWYRTQVYAYDNAGNRARIGTLDTFYDSVAPTASLSLSRVWTNDATDENLLVDVSDNSGASCTVSLLDVTTGLTVARTVTGADGDSSFVITHNGTYTATVTDSSGLTYVSSLVVSNFDNIPTKCYFSETTDSAESQVTFRVSSNYIASHNAGISQIKYMSGLIDPATVASSGTVIAVGVDYAVLPGYYTGVVIDAAGNVGAFIEYIGGEWPQVTFTPSTSGWTKDPYTINVKFTTGKYSTYTARMAQAQTFWDAYGYYFKNPATGVQYGWFPSFYGIGAMFYTDVGLAVGSFYMYDQATFYAEKSVSSTASTYLGNIDYLHNGEWSVPVAENDSVVVYICDDSGMFADVSYVVSNFDSSVPTVSLTQSPAAGTWSSGPVTITATTGDTGGSGVSYTKWMSGAQSTATVADSGTAFSGTFQVSDNGTYTVAVADSAGNLASSSIVVSNYDGTAPSLTLTPSTASWTASPITITAVSSDTGSGMSDTIWMAGNQTAATVKESGTTFSGTFNVSDNDTYSVVAVDAAGNTTLQTIAISNFDLVAPDLTLTPSTVAWTNLPINISATSTDIGGSGVKHTKWALESLTAVQVDDTGTAFSESFPVSANGTYSVVAVDNVLNKTVQQISVTNYDNVAPTLTVAYDIVTMKLSAISSDDLSLIKNVKYAKGSVAPATVAATGTLYAAPFFVALADEGTYTFVAVDNAGNITSQEITAISDAEPPVITLTSSPVAWTNLPVTITSITTDNRTGVAYTKWLLGSKTIADFDSAGTVFTDTFSVSANGTYTVLAADGAGNKAVKTIVVSTYDATAPTLSATFSPITWTRTAITVTVTSSDTDSGISYVKWLKDATTNAQVILSGAVTAGTFSVSENATYRIVAVDNAGNESFTTVTTTKFDNTIPTVSLSQNPVGWTNQPITITATTSDDLSGVAVTKYVKDNVTQGVAATTGTTFSGSFTVTENSVYTVAVIDNAGNVNSAQTTVTAYDNTPPEITLTKLSSTETNGSVQIMAIVYDDLSGVDYTMWAHGGLTAIQTRDTGTLFADSFFIGDNDTYTAVAFDRAGNSSVDTISISNIDVTPPAVPVITFTDAIGGGSTTVYMSGDTDTQDVYYSLDDVTWLPYVGPVTITTSGTVSAYSSDNVGNTSAIVSQTILVPALDAALDESVVASSTDTTYLIALESYLTVVEPQSQTLQVVSDFNDTGGTLTDIMTDLTTLISSILNLVRAC